MQEPVVQSWNTEPLWRELSTLLPGLAIEVVARCESTSTELVERARRSGGVADAVPSRPGELEPPVSGPMPLLEATRHGRRVGDTQPCLLVAEQQTRGRGRWGRSWQSSAGASLTCSLALPFAPPDWSGLSLAIGVALADALDPACALDGAHIGLKWPNDLMRIEPDASPRKMGGILIESVPVGQRRMAVIGVGLNVAPIEAAAAELSQGYACLQELLPGLTPQAALRRVARPLLQAVLQFQREGFAPFKARFEQRDLLAGRPVRGLGEPAIEGIALGIDDLGALRVQVGTEVRVLASGEVSLRLADESA